MSSNSPRSSNALNSADGPASLAVQASAPAAAGLQIGADGAPPPKFELSLPGASQPDIIRANQKDTYYQQILKDQVKDAVRDIFGSRTQHLYQTETEVFSDLCYYSLTTLLGMQTLGEEYCDIMQINGSTKTFPSLARRSTLVFWHVLMPYLYSKGTQELRRRSRPQQSQYGDQRHAGHSGYLVDATLPVDESNQGSTPIMVRLQTAARKWLPALQTFFKTYGHSTHLAVFYFFGAYYSFSKRITGIRYIFNRKLSPGEERSGYEVLGVLIVIQLAVQLFQWRRRVAAAAQEKIAAATALAAGGNSLGEKEVAQEELSDNDEEQLDESSVKKCILCLDPRTNTTATPCGHLFCWTCIREWCQNKPECPLCRQHVQLSALLPIYTNLN